MRIRLLVGLTMTIAPALLMMPPFGRSALAEEAANWPIWRGPLGTGEAPDAKPPIEWNERKNVRWKVALPGRGHSTPIVWGERIYLTTAIPFGNKHEPKFANRPGAHDNLPVSQRHKFVVLAIDRRSGKTLWEKSVREALPVEGGHRTASLASASPLTDGERVIAFFGSHGLYCLSPAGEVVWEKQFGQMHTKHGHGEGASPALWGNTLIVNWDHEGDSFIVAIDKRSGEEIWRRPRNEVTSWATPIVVEHDGRPQAIVAGTERVRSYDLKTGEVIWQCGGLSQNIVATPVYGGGRVFVGSSYEKRALLAIALDGAKGDITGTDNVLWTRRRRTPYVPSPLLVGGHLYFLAHYQNVISRVDARTGEEDGGPFRLGGLANIYASPVAAAGRIYVTDLDGATLVFTDAAQPKMLAVNQLGDRFSASAAVVGDAIYLRGERFLYCLANE